MNLYTQHFQSPAGEMIVAVDADGALTRLVFPNEHIRWAAEIARNGYSITPDAQRCAVVITQLTEYFVSQRHTFDLPLRPIGTVFQRQVWATLQSIPYGTTITYKQLAEQIGNPAAVRAVGRANGSNPIPIIVPCHRVIGADGSLTGFGGGLPLKEFLLKLEGVELLSAHPAQIGLL